MTMSSTADISDKIDNYHASLRKQREDVRRIKLEQFPENVLSNVASYLGPKSHLLLAVALTAPSSSWEKTGWKRQPSRASEIVMAAPVKYDEKTWERFKFQRGLMSSTRAFSDGEIGAILMLIGASTKVSESAVLPILHSILDNENNSLKYAQFPKAWRKNQSKQLTAFLEQFIASSNQTLSKENIGCSMCEGEYTSQSTVLWGNYGFTNMPCYECSEYICKDCELDWKLYLCNSCEKKQCTRCKAPSLCYKCNARTCSGCSYLLDTCSMCDNTSCADCHAVYFCDGCELLLCENCVPAVRCGVKNCYEISCLECAKNWKSRVNMCPCGNYCFECRPAEGGDKTCKECINQSMDFHIQRLTPSFMRPFLELVENYETPGEAGIVMGQMIHFWDGCMRNMFPSDKDFDFMAYERLKKSKESARVLAIYFLLQEENVKAAYMVYYIAFAEEVEARGPQYTADTVTKKLTKVPAYLIIFFPSLVEAIKMTWERKSLLEYVQDPPGADVIRGGIVNMTQFWLAKISEDIDDWEGVHIHSLPCLLDVFENQVDRDHGYTERIKVCIRNLDTSTVKTEETYNDTPLSWLLKMYVFKSNSRSAIQHKKLPLSTKYFRIKHNTEKTLFLSSAGKKTLVQLEIEDGDEILVGGVEHQDTISATSTSAKPNKKSNKKGKKKNRGPKKKKKQPQRHSVPQLTEEQLLEKHRQEHSQAMTPVFEQMDPILKEIRNKLSALTLQKKAPKVRTKKAKKKEAGADVEECNLLPPEDGLGGKAGKILHPILVGEVSNLYKTSKAPSASTIVIDLHGCSREEAANILDNALPGWLDTAMKGDYPFVVPVDVVTGGGSQILSELVQYWIRSNRQVANRPKAW